MQILQHLQHIDWLQLLLLLAVLTTLWAVYCHLPRNTDPAQFKRMTSDDLRQLWSERLQEVEREYTNGGYNLSSAHAVFRTGHNLLKFVLNKIHLNSFFRHTEKVRSISSLRKLPFFGYTQCYPACHGKMLIWVDIGCVSVHKTCWYCSIWESNNASHDECGCSNTLVT